jgi:hypothetical protein
MSELGPDKSDAAIPDGLRDEVENIVHRIGQLPPALRKLISDRLSMDRFHSGQDIDLCIEDEHGRIVAVLYDVKRLTPIRFPGQDEIEAQHPIDLDEIRRDPRRAWANAIPVEQSLQRFVTERSRT